VEKILNRSDPEDPQLTAQGETADKFDTLAADLADLKPTSVDEGWRPVVPSKAHMSVFVAEDSVIGNKAEGKVKTINTTPFHATELLLVEQKGRHKYKVVDQWPRPLVPPTYR
jgi:hypothetical protein